MKKKIVFGTSLEVTIYSGGRGGKKRKKEEIYFALVFARMISL